MILGVFFSTFASSEVSSLYIKFVILFIGLYLLYKEKVYFCDTNQR